MRWSDQGTSRSPPRSRRAHVAIHSDSLLFGDCKALFFRISDGFYPSSTAALFTDASPRTRGVKYRSPCPTPIFPPSCATLTAPSETSRRLDAARDMPTAYPARDAASWPHAEPADLLRGPLYSANPHGCTCRNISPKLPFPTFSTLSLLAMARPTTSLSTRRRPPKPRCALDYAIDKCFEPHRAVTQHTHQHHPRHTDYSAYIEQSRVCHAPRRGSKKRRRVDRRQTRTLTRALYAAHISIAPLRTSTFA
jgi:hypothetical protein